MDVPETADRVHVPTWYICADGRSIMMMVLHAKA